MNIYNNYLQKQLIECKQMQMDAGSVTTIFDDAYLLGKIVIRKKYKVMKKTLKT